MEHIASVFVQVVEKPERKAIIKRGRTAKEYWSYCQEVGCDVWGVLTSMKSLCGEPVCMWLPGKYRELNTSEYVQGVEVTKDYTGIIPDGFDVITLPAGKILDVSGRTVQGGGILPSNRSSAACNGTIRPIDNRICMG